MELKRKWIFDFYENSQILYTKVFDFTQIFRKSKIFAKIWFSEYFRENNENFRFVNIFLKMWDFNELYVFFQVDMSCPPFLGCPVQVVLLQMSCPRCHIPDALSQKSCQGCPAAVVLTWLSCPSWPGPATMTTAILKLLYFICYHVMARALSLWSRLTCPG
jgi:hypothetical protein